MACWQTAYITVLRVLINDLSSDPDFTDSRLEDVLVVAAAQVNQEIQLSVDYTVVISPPSITPNPVNDEIFMNLTTLKAACLIDRGSLRVAAAINGVEAKCGPAVMKVARRMDGFAILISQGYCAAYQEARLQYGFGNGAFCKAILSPFVNDTFDPWDLNLGNDNQDRHNNKI